jgi:hypothetical protein
MWQDHLLIKSNHVQFENLSLNRNQKCLSAHSPAHLSLWAGPTRQLHVPVLWPTSHFPLWLCREPRERHVHRAALPPTAMVCHLEPHPCCAGFKRGRPTIWAFSSHPHLNRGSLAGRHTSTTTELQHPTASPLHCHNRAPNLVRVGP